ncbi:hypothetical protein HDR58_11050 [bacterium]|nr:hypothetical protein [bacterium]
MKVENYNQNIYGYRKNSYNSQLNTNTNYQPNFKGGTASVRTQILNHLNDKKAIDVMNSIKWLKGELGGILITAFGTGLVAPVFIAFNPFVKAPEDATPEKKEDIENTKKYTAMRQPISAVLAGIFQAGALGPIDRFLEKITNDPKYSKSWWVTLDQSALNKRSYLERTIKNKMKNEDVQYDSSKDFKKELARRVDIEEAQQIKAVAQNLKKNGTIMIGDRPVKNQTVAELINEQISSYIDDAKQLQIDEKGLEFYTKRSKELVTNEDYFKQLFKNMPTNDNKALESYIKNAMDSTDNADIKTILKEILDHDESVRASRCQNTITRINTIKHACDGHYTPEAYLESMKARNADIDNIIKNLEDLYIGTPRQIKVKQDGKEILKTVYDVPKDVDAKTVQETAENLVNNCHYNHSNTKLHRVLDRSGTFRSNMTELKDKIYTDIVKGYKKFVDDNYKGFSQMSKVAIGVCITLPITCTLLNWVYPRFMELCFPKISGVKKDKVEEEKNGGNQ